jgi:mRNA-degrading endonuclease toxin of MazEF toxin-antitoxin module
MQQWEIWLVKQQYARKELNPPQPNDPSDYDRMYVVVANPRRRTSVICCPVQNSLSGVGITEIALTKGYQPCITKDCKIVAHDIFTLPQKFFETKRGALLPSEQDKVQTAIALVFGI